MRIISRSKIRDFTKKHPDAKVGLDLWYKKVKRSKWSNFNDMKTDFGSVDYLGKNRYVFNIKGNHYRLVAIVQIVRKVSFIRFIGTHKEYDKIDCLKI